jgi:hypothetical protein
LTYHLEAASDCSLAWWAKLTGEVKVMSTFREDGYSDGYKGLPPTPSTGVPVYGSEYMDGFRLGYHEHMKETYFDMPDDEIMYALREELNQIIVRMDGNYKNLMTTDEQNRVMALLAIANRR